MGAPCITEGVHECTRHFDEPPFPASETASQRDRTMWIDKLQCVTDVQDFIHHVWERPVVQRRTALIIFWVYVLVLAWIEAGREGLLPPWLARLTPRSHFYAIHLAFTLILGLEVMSLILTISSSVARSVGKQFEILALILLRNAFKELGNLPEPVSVAQSMETVINIAVSGFGALFVFACLCLYMRLFKVQHFIQSPEMRMRYVMSKKLLALALFLIFFGIGVRDVCQYLRTGEVPDFFATIYTVLIFADIALVLISQRYMPTFNAVFRNSGFVIGTLLMRLSFSALPPWDTVISMGAAVYILALTWVTNRFAAGPAKKESPSEP
jgi:hypothetical protein